MSKWVDQFLADWKKMTPYEQMCHADEYETCMMVKTSQRHTAEELVEKYKNFKHMLDKGD